MSLSMHHDRHQTSRANKAAGGIGGVEPRGEHGRNQFFVCGRFVRFLEKVRFSRWAQAHDKVTQLWGDGWGDGGSRERQTQGGVQDAGGGICCE